MRLALTHVDGGVGVADSLLAEAALLQSSVHRLQGNLLLRVHLLRLELVDAKQPVVPVQNAEIGMALFVVEVHIMLPFKFLEVFVGNLCQRLH